MDTVKAEESFDLKRKLEEADYKDVNDPETSKKVKLEASIEAPVDALEEPEIDELSMEETEGEGEAHDQIKQEKPQFTFNEAKDEYISEVDSQGESKIDKSGKLLGGRQFRISTFVVVGKGTKQFMLATKVARMLNLRDSHNLFTKYPQLAKVQLTTPEKFDLIDRKILPLSYKSRPVNVIAAKSVFKVFGSKCIYNGRKVTDDYYEQQAIDRGDVVGAPAYIDPRSIVINEDSSNLGASSLPANHDHQPAIDLNSKFSVKSNIIKTMITEENWMLNHCLASKQLDYDASYDRQRFWNVKSLERDPYTGVRFISGASQPKVAKWSKIIMIDKDTKKQIETKYVKNDVNSGRLTYSTILRSRGSVIPTGLKNVSEDIFNGVVTPEIKKAILQQQLLEKIVRGI